MKTWRWLLIVAFIQSCGANENSCPDATCADYKTQEAAQAAFDADPDCLDGLDTDNDGIACEHLPSAGSGSTGCPTTSNCGCSGKNKDQCASACCKWVTGQGCKCK